MNRIQCDHCDKWVDQKDGNVQCDAFICDNCNEAAYDRQQERLMEEGPGPTLQEQQIEAYKIKRGLR